MALPLGDTHVCRIAHLLSSSFVVCSSKIVKTGKADAKYYVSFEDDTRSWVERNQVHAGASMPLMEEGEQKSEWAPKWGVWGLSLSGVRVCPIMHSGDVIWPVR